MAIFTIPALLLVGRGLWIAARATPLFAAKTLTKTPAFLLWFGIGSATTVAVQINYKKYIAGAIVIFLLYKKIKS